MHDIVYRLSNPKAAAHIAVDRHALANTIHINDFTGAWEAWVPIRSQKSWEKVAEQIGTVGFNISNNFTIDFRPFLHLKI